MKFFPIKIIRYFFNFFDIINQLIYVKKTAQYLTK